MKNVMTLTILTFGLLAAAGDSPVDRGKRIRELHKERIAVLRQVVDLTSGAYKTEGIANYKEILKSHLSLINAELDASETDQDRVAIFEKKVELLKQAETAMERGVKTGEILKTDILSAKAERLHAEIMLERLKFEISNQHN